MDSSMVSGCPAGSQAEREYELVLTVELEGYGTPAQEEQLRKRVEEILRTRLHNETIRVRRYQSADGPNPFPEPEPSVGTLGDRIRRRAGWQGP